MLKQLSKISLIATTFVVFILGVFWIINAFLRSKNLGLDVGDALIYVVIAIITFWFAAFSTYVISRLENFDLQMEEMCNQRSWQSCQLCMSRDELFKKMRETIEDCQNVYALNFSENHPEDTGGEMKKYYRYCEEYIKKRGGQLVSFRRISRAGNKRKALWLLETVIQLRRTSKYSVAFFDIDPSQVPVLSFVVVEKKNSYYTFLFPPVPAHPSTEGVLLHHKETGELLVRYFNNIWFQATPLLDGDKLFPENITKMISDYNLSMNILSPLAIHLKVEA
jgi:hypothetical protein